MARTYCILICTLLMASSLARASLALQPSDPKKSIVISENQQQFQLVLPANPTTGYQWFLTGIDHNLLDPVAERYQASKTSLMGAGGYDIWTFQLKPQAVSVPWITAVKLHYARAWEAQTSEETIYTIVLIGHGKAG